MLKNHLSLRLLAYFGSWLGFTLVYSVVVTALAFWLIPDPTARYMVQFVLGFIGGFGFTTYLLWRYSDRYSTY